jgi:3-hydroxybutyryl-CoA dehydrogenase
MQQVTFPVVGIIGAGAMGRGIAQIAAQAGSVVKLFDTRSEAVVEAVQAISGQWSRLQEKGRMTMEALAENKSRLIGANALSELSDCSLVVEAIVERIDIKKGLFAELEAIVGSQAVLATNTSSLSVTAIAADLKYPQRFAGFHFFNPVPLMKVVEVIAGLKTDPSVCDALTRFARQMGHTPVQAQDTPGFIVNHAGRGYGTEALRIVSEGVADFATIDRILKDQAGFRLGPFELMDLTALDVSHPVMESIYHQYYEEPRYRPSVITAQRLAGGVVGKKVGEGFYRYENGVPQVAPEPAAPLIAEMPPVWVSPRASRRAELLQLLKDLDARIETGSSPSPAALTVVAPLGFDVTTVAVVERLDPARTVGIDLLIDDAATKRRVLATNPATRVDMRDAAHALFRARRQGGQRDSRQRWLCDPAGGFHHRQYRNRYLSATDLQPAGSGDRCHAWAGLSTGSPGDGGPGTGPTNILEVLFNMQTVYGDPRYRPSPWLRRRGAIGLSLLHTEE